MATGKKRGTVKKVKSSAKATTKTKSKPGKRTKKSAKKSAKQNAQASLEMGAAVDVTPDTTKKRSAPARKKRGAAVDAMTNTTIADTTTALATQFVERAYLDYAMTVILDRALPILGDGLKPVQRRIVYVMSELGLSAQSKPKKSARTIGDVIGKFHPHGDVACYEAMVLMAQSFSYRYPLVDGHGNWGSVDDPKSFAAMRYTEARLTPYAKLLTEELPLGTVTWRPNFDNTIQEPEFLPAKIPNILLNGASGIAVGMSTDIPPHNFGEVVKACIALLDKPKTTDTELLKIIRGPDFPGGGVICSDAKTIREIYTTGTGNLKVRARYEVDKKSRDIVITEMPYQVSTVRAIEQIVSQIRNKKLPFISNLRDESNEEAPVRVVISPKGNKVSPDELMSHLFASTDLERVCRVNLNVIEGGRPIVKSLKEMLQSWLAFRSDTVHKRTEWRLECIRERLEILEGLLTAHAHIDEVIKVIRNSEDPQTDLMKRFKLTELQAHAILEIKLRRLAKLEYIKIKEEQKDLLKEQKELDAILNSKARLKTRVKKELQECMDLYADERRTKIQAGTSDAQALNLSDFSTDEPMTVVASTKGWIRSFKGHEIEQSNLKYQSGDDFLAMIETSSKSKIIFFDETGQCFCTPVADLPSGKGHGEPLSKRFAVHGSLKAMINASESGELLLISSAGDALRTEAAALSSSTNRNGKKVMNVAEGVSLARVCRVSDGGMAVVATSGKNLLAIPAEELPLLSRGKGVRFVKLKPGEGIDDVACVNKNQRLSINKLRLLYEELDQYVGKRGTRGRKVKDGKKVLRVITPLEIKDLKEDPES